MNYNTTPHSQDLPTGTDRFLPQEYGLINKTQFRGDWLAIIGRKFNDTVLTRNFVANFKQGKL